MISFGGSARGDLSLGLHLLLSLFLFSGLLRDSGTLGFYVSPDRPPTDDHGVTVKS